MRLTIAKANANTPGRRPRTGGQERFALSGPGREAPALADFCVEPQLLEFWELKKSFARTPRLKFAMYGSGIQRVIKIIRHSATRPLTPRQRCVCLTMVALLLIPLPHSSQSVRENAIRCSSTRCAYRLHRVLLIVAVEHTARRRHSRAQSPDIPGRIIFFVTATGRSPPSADGVPPG